MPLRCHHELCSISELALARSSRWSLSPRSKNEQIIGQQSVLLTDVNAGSANQEAKWTHAISIFVIVVQRRKSPSRPFANLSVQLLWWVSTVSLALNLSPCLEHRKVPGQKEDHNSLNDNSFLVLHWACQISKERVFSAADGLERLVLFARQQGAVYMPSLEQTWRNMARKKWWEVCRLGLVVSYLNCEEIEG